jgi:hypothetical protein
VTAGAGERRPIRLRSYALLFVLFAAFVVPTHLWLARLPYFWDEAGQFIPAALDLFQRGAWIPQSAEPNIHPPGVAAYLAAVWRIAGCSPLSTRLAMLGVATAAAMAAFLLAIELNRETNGAPALLAAAALCLSPLFFAQAVLAELDLPAMLFTTLALLLFLQNHVKAAAAACLALVLVKETGAVLPLTLGLWLVRERRWRDAAWFAAAIGVLAGRITVLALQTGHWAGNAEFVRYNLAYPLHPMRLTATLGRRLYFLLFANFHWVGTAAIAVAWRSERVFRGRAWRVAASVAAAHVLLYTLLGGAVLNRYLLPALPVLYAAMAGAIAMLPKGRRIAASAVLLAGSAASNFLNPPYPFPYEENLAFADFASLHQQAAAYIGHWYADPVVHSAWPMTAELERPELGYVSRPLRVRMLPDLTAATIGGLNWRQVEILVVFSREWDPPFNLGRLIPFGAPAQQVTREEARARTPFPPDASFFRRGQWVDIYVNPSVPRIPHAELAASGTR